VGWFMPTVFSNVTTQMTISWDGYSGPFVSSCLTTVKRTRFASPTCGLVGGMLTIVEHRELELP